MADPPLTFRRLVGLDRSGGPPPQTRRGEPLNPWTIPNAIGFARLALVPLFLAVGLSSGDGRSGLAFALFAFIAWSDYFDGMAARVTGQYSRLGALLDPLTDRVLILSGAIVAWHYETLPRWALLVLAAREALMLVLTQVALRRGFDLESLDARPLGRLARDERARARARDRELGARRAALRGRRDDSCGHGPLPARWGAGASQSLNLYLRKRYSRALPALLERTALDTFPDLGALSDSELKDLIQQLTEEEQEVSYKRRILHGKIDILRAELVNRLRKKHEEGESVISGADVQQLTDILSGKGIPADADIE